MSAPEKYKRFDPADYLVVIRAALEQPEQETSGRSWCRMGLTLSPDG